MTTTLREASSARRAASPAVAGARRPAFIIDRVVLMVGATVVYLAAMATLSAQDLLFTDAVSRVGNAYYAVASRDPHLAAIGFVWNPLPSLVSMPLLALARLWPPLASLGLAAAIPVTIAGGVTVGVLHWTLRELGAGRWAAVVLTVIYALHPYVVVGAGSGSSETLMLLWLILACAALVRWATTDDPRQLVLAGSFLALGYLTRYEALAATLGVAAGVAIMGARRARERRWLFVVNDVTIALFPTALAFATWAAAGKAIVGEWFSTFTSSYGNAAQVAYASSAIASSTTGPFGRIGYALGQASSLEPLLLPLIALALWLALRRSALRILAPLAVFGSVIAFQWGTLAMGGSFGWLRFEVCAIPLAVLTAGSLFGVRPFAVSRTLRVVVTVLMCTALPMSAWALTQPTIAREETIMVASGRAGQHSMERQVAAWLDAADLPDGAVITDVAYSGPIVLASAKPKQFVITTDRDFAEVLSNPAAHGVRYALVTKPEVSAADAVAKQYPGLFNTGAGIASLSMEWHDQRGYTWRLYRLA